MNASRSNRRAEPETVTHGTQNIGSVLPAPEGGFDALDPDGNLIDTFETITAARRALFERHKGSPA